MTLRNTCAPSRKGKSQLVKYSCDHDYVLKWSTPSPNNYYICIRYLHIMFGFFFYCNYTCTVFIWPTMHFCSQRYTWQLEKWESLKNQFHRKMILKVWRQRSLVYLSWQQKQQLCWWMDFGSSSLDWYNSWCWATSQGPPSTWLPRSLCGTVTLNTSGIWPSQNVTEREADNAQAAEAHRDYWTDSCTGSPI